MKNNPLSKHRNLILFAVYAVLALSVVAVFWIWKDTPIKGELVARIYTHAFLWIVLPLMSLSISYVIAFGKAPAKVKIFMPLIFGGSMAAVEYVTLCLEKIIAEENSLPILSLVVGLVASFFGLVFGKIDRAAKDKEDGGADEAISEAPKTESAPKAERKAEEYDPGDEFIPDEDDTWADEVLEREGFGELTVDYAEHDSDLSVDSPDGDNECDGDGSEAWEDVPCEEDSACDDGENNSVEEPLADAVDNDENSSDERICESEDAVKKDEDAADNIEDENDEVCTTGVEDLADDATSEHGESDEDTATNEDTDVNEGSPEECENSDLSEDEI